MIIIVVFVIFIIIAIIKALAIIIKVTITINQKMKIIMAIVMIIIILIIYFHYYLPIIIRESSSSIIITDLQSFFTHQRCNLLLPAARTTNSPVKRNENECHDSKWRLKQLSLHHSSVKPDTEHISHHVWIRCKPFS